MVPTMIEFVDLLGTSFVFGWRLLVASLVTFVYELRTILSVGLAILIHLFCVP